MDTDSFPDSQTLFPIKVTVVSHLDFCNQQGAILLNLLRYSIAVSLFHISYGANLYFDVIDPFLNLKLSLVGI